MAMTARQSEALRDLTTRGVLSADQESAVRAALEDTGAPPRVADRVAELAAYVGGGLVLGGAALLLGLSWEDMSRLARAGVLGAANWVVAAVGVGLCLSGPPSTGHWGYGIAAAVATGVHLVLLLVLVGQGKEYSAGTVVDPHGAGVKWGLVPTRMDAVTFYLTFLLYHEQELIPKAKMNLSIVVGVAEMVRTMRSPKSGGGKRSGLKLIRSVSPTTRTLSQ